MRQAVARCLRVGEQELDRGSLTPLTLRDAAAKSRFTQNVLVPRHLPSRCNANIRNIVRRFEHWTTILPRVSDAGLSCACQESAYTEESGEGGGQSGYGSWRDAEKEEGCERGDDETPTGKDPRSSHGGASSFSDEQKNLEIARNDHVTSTERPTHYEYSITRARMSVLTLRRNFLEGEE